MLKTMMNTPSDAETNLVAETMSSGGSDSGSKRRLLLLSPLFLLFLCLSLFFASSASSHGTGLLSITGREAAAGSGSRVALAAAAWGADSEEGKVYDDAGPLGWFLVLKKVEVDDGGSGGFLGYFLCSGKEKKYRWWLNYSVGVVLQSPPFSPPLLLLFFLLSPLCPFLSLCFFSVFFVSSPLFCPFPPLSSPSCVLFLLSGLSPFSPPFNKTLLVLNFFLSPFQKVFPPSPLSPAFFFFFTPLLCFFSFFPFSRLFPPPPLFSSLFIGKNGAGAPSITQRLVGQ